MRKFYIIIFTLILTHLLHSAIDRETAQNVASQTLKIFTNMNMILNQVNNKADINENIKKELKEQADKLKELKKRIKQLKLSSSAKQIQLLKEQFNKGKYSEALKKTIKNFFQNIKRIKKIDGGQELAKMVSI
jgi:archaellum component FlaC